MTAKTDFGVPDPGHLVEEFEAFKRSLALRAALELDLFTRVDSGFVTSAALAAACQASERGIRILCDYLTVRGHLSKERETYGLPLNSRLYLSRNSESYIGAAVKFLAGPSEIEAFEGLAQAVRDGGCAGSRDEGRETDYWVGFAEFMAPLARPVARFVAASIELNGGAPLEILDVAAGHGLYGLAIADRYPEARIFAMDLPGVLEIARRNARLAGAAERYHLVPGDVFEDELGGPYDAIVLANFCHHFGERENTALFVKLRATLRDSGQLILVDFVPADDRVSPGPDAAFAIDMLARTAGGRTYTFSEFSRMLSAAGFGCVRRPDLGHLPQWVITASE